MDIRKLQRAIVDGLEDVKAQNIVVFNTEALSPLFERVIVASGASNRQTKALASSVRDAVKAGGMQVLRTEGEDNGEWIIVDCGAAVAHIMQPAIRDYYRLEEIWGAKPVKLKLGDSTPRALPKAQEEPLSPAKAAAAAKKKPAAKKPAAQSPAAKKATAGATAARKAPARKAVAGKTSAAAKATPTKAPARKIAAGKVPARKTAAAQGPAGKRAAPATRRRG